MAAPQIAYLVHLFGKEQVEKRLGSAAVSAAKPPPPSSATTNDDDDFDLFGEETAEEKAAREKLAQEAKGAAASKKEKKKVIEKSTLVIEVKPNSIDTSLADIEKAVREISMEGLEWSKVSKQVPIAFGLMKLQIGCIIVDEHISTDDLIEKIESIGMNDEQRAKYMKSRDEGDAEDDDDADEEEIGGWVQSAEIVSFQKL